MSRGTAPPPPSAPPPPEAPPSRFELVVDQRIRQTRRQIKVADLAAGLMALAALALAYLLAAALIDHWLVPGGLGRTGRVVLLAGLLLLLAASFRRCVLPLLLYPIHPIYAAQTIEEVRPSLKNALINLLFLRAERARLQQDQLARSVYQGLERTAASELAALPEEATVDRSRVIRLGYVLVAVLSVAALYLLLSPKNLLSSFGRVVLPWADIQPPTRVTFESIRPQDTAAYQGDFVPVTAVVRGLRDDEPVLLYYTTADGQSVNQAVVMTVPEGGYRHRGQLPPGPDGLQQHVVYYLAAGDCRSRQFRISVDVPPTIIVETVHYDYPDYTGLDDRSDTLTGDVQAPEGTRVTVHAQANLEIDRAWLEMNADPRQVIMMRARGRQATGTIPLRMSRDDPGRPEYDSYQVRFRDPQRRENRRPTRYRIQVIPDLPPKVAFVDPPPERIGVPADGFHDFPLRAEDPDFALRRVRWRAERDDKPLNTRPLLDKPAPGPGFEGPFQATYRFTPNRWGLRPGDEVIYWAEAADNKENDAGPAPNRGMTPRYWIQITAPENAPPTPEQPPAVQPGENPPQQPSAERTGEQQQPENIGEEPSDHPPEAAQKAPGQQTPKPESQPAEDQPPQQPGQPDAEQQPAGPEQPGDQGAGQQGAGQQGAGQPGSGQQGAGQAAGDQRGDRHQPSDQQGTGQGGASRQGGDQQEPGGEPTEGPSPGVDQGGPGASPGSTGGSSPGAPSGTGARDRAAPGAAPEAPAGQGPSEASGQRTGGPGAEGQETPRRPADPETDPGEAIKRILEHRAQEDASPGSAQPAAERPRSPSESQAPGDGGAAGSPQPPGAGPQEPRPEAGAAEGGQPPEGQPGQRPEPAPGGPGESTERPQGDRQSPSAGQPGTRPESGAGPESPQPGPGGRQPAEGPHEPPPAAVGGQEPERPAGQPQETGPNGQRQGASQQRPGPAGAGENSGQRPGSPEPQGPNRPGETSPGRPPEGERPSGAQPASSPSISPRQSDSQSDTAGDRSGAGGAGGGQQAPQPGHDLPGTQAPADQGGAPAGQQGPGPTGPDAGDRVRADRPTGQSAPDRQGGGSAGRQPGVPGEGPPRGHRAPQPGRGPGDSPQPAAAPPPGPDGDEGNLEYARKQTELALEHLEDQLAKQDSELLDQLGWTREDAEAFLRHWRQMQEAAGREGDEGRQAAEVLDEAIRGLGLRPHATQLDSDFVQRHLRSVRDARRFDPPPEWAEMVHEYLKSSSPRRPAPP